MDGWGYNSGIDLARVQFEGGGKKTDWEDRTVQEEEKLVQRYYQRHTVGAEGYGNADGATVGVFQQWHVQPYPGYQSNTYTSIGTDKVVESIEWNPEGNDSTNTSAAADADILWAHSDKGFKAGRKATTAGMVNWNGTYHFDFSIYDDPNVEA